MTKRPSIQFYTGDWLKDPCLGQCRPATRGIWIDMLALMNENEESGELRGTPESLARICRCSAKEMRAALADLSATNTADVTQRHGEVTVRNRRMSRAFHERVSARNRKRKQRGSTQSHGSEPSQVTEKSRSHSSSSSSDPSLRSGSLTDDRGRNRSSLDSEYSPEFEAAWSVYPRRTGGNPKRRAWHAWRARIASGATEDEITDGVRRYAAFCDAAGKTGTEYVMQAATFFGPDERFREEWVAPANIAALTWARLKAMSDSEIEALAGELGVKTYGKEKSVLYPQLIEADRKRKEQGQAA